MGAKRLNRAFLKARFIGDMQKLSRKIIVRMREENCDYARQLLRQ